MTPVLYPLQSQSLSQKRGVDWELCDGRDEKDLHPKPTSGHSRMHFFK